MKRKIGIACAVLLLATTLGLSQEAFFPMGATGTVYGWMARDYLPQAESLGATWAQLDGYWCWPDTVANVCNRAHQRGISIILNSAWIPQPGRDTEQSRRLNLSRLASGQTLRYEAEGLFAPGDKGVAVSDSDASAGHAWRVLRADTGWFQQAERPDYISNVGMDTLNRLAYTSFYRLKASFGPADTPGAPVCELFVTEEIRHAEHVIASKLLTRNSFSGQNIYDTFAVPYFKNPTDTGLLSYGICFHGNAETLWSDYAEYYDKYADSLLRTPPGDTWPPYRAVVKAIGEYFLDSVPPPCRPYRFYLADEADPDQFKCWQKVDQWSGHMGISWNPSFSTLRRYVDAVGPREVYVDALPLMGRTYPSWADSTTGHRTPPDSGSVFQGRLDTFCFLLDTGRVVARNHNLPLYVDGQAFGDVIVHPYVVGNETLYPYKSVWNSGPPADTMDEDVYREPDGREFRCMAWLALAHGAKGLDFYSLPTLGPTHWYSKWAYGCGLLGYDSVGGHPAGHRPIFDTVRTFYGSVLQRIGKTLQQLTSDDAGKGAAGFVVHSSDGLVHFGTFTGPHGSYFIAVNRRCRQGDAITDTIELEQVGTGTSYFLHDELTNGAIAPSSSPSPNHYRYPVPLDPGQGRLFNLVPFCGSISRNQGQGYANMPEVALTLDYNDGTMYGRPDSMRIYCYDLPTGLDSVFGGVDSTGWLPYRHDHIYTVRQEGWYRFSVRYKLSQGILSPLYASPGIGVCWTACRDSMVLNHNAAFTNAVRCTVCSHLSGTAPAYQMQCTNNWMMKLELIDNPELNDSAYWAEKNCHYVESLGVARMDILPNAQSYIRRLIPADSLAMCLNQQMTLEADVVSDSFQGNGRMSLEYVYVYNDTTFGHDTIYVPPLPGADIQTGTAAQVGTYNYSLPFVYNPTPPSGEHPYGLRLGITADAGSKNGGRLYLGSIRLDVAPADPNPNNPIGWAPFDSLYDHWYLNGVHGVNIVKARYRDYAGNEAAWVADAIFLEQRNPQATISFPTKGTVATETLLSVDGLAYEPSSPSDPSHFENYKLTWSRSIGSLPDSFVGISNESLYYQEQPLVPPESILILGGPYRHLADWNTAPIRSQFGNGWYKLKLDVTDSAGNAGSCQVTVKFTDSTELERSSGGSSGAATSLTTTPTNDIYVATSTGKLIQYTGDLDSLGALSLAADSAGTPIVSGVTTDSTGAIYVSDLRARDLKCYDPSGTLEQTIGNRQQLASPDDIAVAPNGDLYTIDRTNSAVRVYDQTGALKRSFGAPGSDTGCFDQPVAIALSYPRGLPGDTTGAYTTPTRVMVADKLNHRVQVFDTAGHFQVFIGLGLLQLPCALAEDSFDNTFVADAQAIYGFSPNGHHYLTISSDTITPIATALSKDNGFIYAIDSKHNTLAQYTVLYTDSTVYGGAQSSRTDPLLIPKEVMLGQSWPNPSTGQLTIRYGVPRMMKLNLKVYDITGKVVRTLVNNETMKPGFYNLQWNCADARNRHVASGVYFYRLTANSGKQQTNVKTKKLVIAR